MFYNTTFIKFCSIALVNFIVGFCLYYFIVIVTHNEEISFIVSYMLGILFNFLSYSFVFKYTLTGKALINFILKYICMLTLSGMLFKLGLELNINDKLCYAASCGLALVFYYLYEKRIINHEKA